MGLVAILCLYMHSLYHAVSGSMLSKNKRPYDVDDLPPRKRLLHNVRDIWANNLLPSSRVQELLNDAADAGASGCRSMRRPATGNNTARNLRRAYSKRNQWPSLYLCSVRVKHPKSGEECVEQLAFMLPHESIEVLARLGDPTVLQARLGMDPKSQQHLESCEAKAGCQLVGVGLWGDGVPCNWDRTESAECFSVNLPGQAKDYKGLRLPVTTLSRKMIGPHTWHDIMEVIAWSFRHLAAGVWPLKRHDGSDFSKADARRATSAGQPLGIRGALVEVRGDWKMFAEVFGFPKWNNSAGLCWRCNCTPDQITDVGSNASWRRTRTAHWELIAKIRANGAKLSPLLQAPWVTNEIFRVDWLHAADQGVTADWLGHVFKLLLTKLPGNTLNERTSALWSQIRAFYEAGAVQDRLQNLQYTMIQQPQKAAKLRASGAQVRALVPFAAEAANRLLNTGGLVDEAARAGTNHLAKCYGALSNDSIHAVDTLKESSMRFALQYVSLRNAHADDPKAWRIKPKLHMFLELCSEGSHPAKFWNYRDEDWGGSVARMARRRGGELHALTFSTNVLSRFKVQQPVIRMKA